jgi:hypothetical protein
MKQQEETSGSPGFLNKGLQYLPNQNRQHEMGNQNKQSGGVWCEG